MNYKLDIELSPELEVYRDKIEATIQPYIEIKLTDNDKPTWWQSKFGGLPYLPKGFEYPKSKNGEYLYLLAQINFAEVPHLEGFPDKGILQFYIHDGVDDIIWGFDTSNPTNQDYFRVLYFSDVKPNEDNLITDFSFLTKPQGYGIPVDGCCALKFEHRLEPVTTNDYQFDLFDTYEEEYKSIYEEYWDKFCQDKHKLGGYANFTQEDPRFYCNKEEEPYLLLLQIVSDGFYIDTYMGQRGVIGITWGDGGIGNFFIKKSALERLDFSNVLYNWDSC